MWELDYKESWVNCGVGEDSWESLRRSNRSIQREIVLNIHWKDWCWSWNSNTLATWCGELTHLKRPWCWERLKVGGEGDNRGWDGWMASPTQWMWVWASSGSWWTGKPGVLPSMGSQRVGYNWATELNWTSHITFSSSNPLASLLEGPLWSHWVQLDKLCWFPHHQILNLMIMSTKSFLPHKVT